MADKTLSAHFSVTENVTDKLEEIQDELEQTAAEATATAGALEGVDEAAEDLDSSVDDLNESTEGLTEGVEEAKSLFGETSEQMESVSDSVDDAKESLEGVNHATNDVSSNIEDFEIRDVAESMSVLDESAQRFTETAGESEEGFESLKESVSSTKYSVSQTSEQLDEATDELSETADVSDDTAGSISDVGKSLDNVNNDLSRAKSRMHDFQRGAEGLMEAGQGVGESVEYVGKTGEDLRDQMGEARESVQELNNSFEESETNAFDFQRRLGGVGEVSEDVREKVATLEDNMEEFAGKDFEGISGPFTDREAQDPIAAAFGGETRGGGASPELLGDNAVENVQEASRAMENVKEQMQDLDEAGAEAMFPDIEEKLAKAGAQAGGVKERKRQVFGIPDDIGKAMEQLDAIKEMKAVNTELGQVSRSTAQGVSEEGAEMANAMRQAEGLSEMKDAVRNSNVALTKSASEAAGQIAEEKNKFLEAKAAGKSVSGTLDELADEETELGRMAMAANKVLDEQAQEEYENAAAALTAAEATDEFQEELREITASAIASNTALDKTSDEISEVGRSGLAASLNLGPFNFALSSLAVDLPIIIGMLGGLAASLGGVAAAAGLAAGAMGAIFAGGVLQMKKQGKSIQDLMKTFKEELKSAMEPLANQQSLQMLRDFLDGIVRAVNAFAKTIAGMQDVFANFQNTVGSAFFKNLPNLLAQIEMLIRALLPYVEDFFVWFFEKLPGALAFFRKQGQRILPVIADIGNNLINFLREFSKAGVTFLKGILPAIGAFLSVLTDIIQVFNAIPGQITSTLITIGAFVFILIRAVEWGQKLADKLTGMIDSTAELGKNFRDLAADIAAAGDNTEELNEAFKNFQENRQAAVGEGDERQGFFGKLAGAASTALTLNSALGTTSATALGGAASSVLGGGSATAGAASAMGLSGGGAAASGGITSAVTGGTSLGLSSLIPSLSGLIGGLVTALSELGTALAGMSSTIALLVSYTNPVTAAIVTIVIALGALLALFTSLDTIMQMITGTLAWLGKVVMAIVGPAFNLFLEILDLLLAPVYAVADGIKTVLATFSPFIGILQFFGKVILGIAAAIGWVINMAAGVIDFFAGVVYTFSKLPFDLLAGVLSLIFGLIDALVQFIMHLQIVQHAIGLVSRLINQFVKIMIRGWGRLVQGFEDLINAFVGILNTGIKLINKAIPFVDPLSKIGKVDFNSGESGADVLTGGKAEDQMEEQEKTVTQKFIEKHQYDLSGSEFNMKPEEKARVKGLIQEAIREANRERRMQDGGV